MHRLRSSPYLQMVLATILFALMGVCVKAASAHFGTAAVVAARGLVGLVLMAAMAWAAQIDLRTRVPWLHVKRGLAGVIALSMWFYVMSHLPLATAVTLNYMSSIWVAVFLGLTIWWTGVGALDRRVVLAIGVGFLGVALVLHPTIEREQWLAGVMGLGSGMLSAIAYIQVTALGRAGEPEIRVVFYFSLMGSVLGLLFNTLPGAGNPSAWADIPVSAWLALFGVGAFATIAQVLMTRAYARGSMLVVANLQYLGIVHASLLGFFVFDEALRPDGLLGMALIIGSGMASTRFKPAAPSASSDKIKP